MILCQILIKLIQKAALYKTLHSESPLILKTVCPSALSKKTTIVPHETIPFSHKNKSIKTNILRKGAKIIKEKCSNDAKIK